MDRSAARRVAEEIGNRRYEMWFDRQMARLRVEGGSLRVDTANQYVADWIHRHFARELTTVACELIGDGATVAMHVAPDCFGRGDREADRPGQRSEHAPGDRDDTRTGRNGDLRRLPPPPQRRPSGPRGGDRRGAALRRLDEFVAGPSNQFALDAARRLAEAEDATSHLLFVHGDCGVGKTHLLQGICERRRTLFPRQQIRYTTAEQFTNEYIAAVRENSLDQFRRSLRRLDLLAIDDIHFLSNKTATQGEFLHTMDAIDLTGARIVLASDEHPRQIRKFSQALVSRFLSGMVVHVDRPDRETRLRLVRRLAADRGLVLQAGAEDIVANRCVGSVREIEGALARLSAFASLSAGQFGGEVGLSAASVESRLESGSNPSLGGDPGLEIGTIVAERALAVEGGRPSGPVRVSDIIERVCEQLAVDRDELVGSGRHRRVVLARGIAVYLARELTTQSFPEIARALGRDTHSTAHTAAKRIEQLLLSGERVDVQETAVAGSDGKVAMGELLAQLRHAILRPAKGAEGPSRTPGSPTTPPRSPERAVSSTPAAATRPLHANGPVRYTPNA